MQVIDFERKGNVIRFYLGEKTKDWGWTNKDYKDYTGKIPDWLSPREWYTGDDWDDEPYEHNAGKVYDEYIKGYYDLVVPFDYLVLEPCDGVQNSMFTKDDMRNGRVPCIIIVPKEEYEDDYDLSFNRYVGSANITKIYFGDDISDIKNKVKTNEVKTTEVKTNEVKTNEVKTNEAELSNSDISKCTAALIIVLTVSVIITITIAMAMTWS